MLVSRYRYNTKFGIWMMRNHKFHCHDEEEYCRTGDKVIIRYCGKKLSPIKYYFVRNVVLPIGRGHTYDQKDVSIYEKEAINYNEALREGNTRVYF